MTASDPNNGPQPSVFIVLLNWNGLADTLQCIERLKAQDYPNRHLLVIDNGSSDGSATALAAIEGIRFRALPHNTGYTGGNNFAIEWALREGADFIWLLNNDTLVPPDCLSALVSTAQADPQIGLVSPVLYHLERPAEVQHCSTRFDLQTLDFDETCDPQVAERWQTESPQQIALWGTALLLSRALVERIGVLDDRLFAYREDLDYSLRSARAGFRNVVCTATSVHHHWPEGTRRPYYYYFMVRNELLVWPRHLSRLLALKKAWWNWARTRQLMARLAGEEAAIQAAMAGLWHGWRGIGGPYRPERRMPAALQVLLGLRSERDGPG